MKCRTRQNTITLIVGTTPIEILGPNPKRKAFMLSPVAVGTTEAGSLLAKIFFAGAGQSWNLPNGVNAIFDAYCFGAGGNGSLVNGGFGGGGGGGGGFASSGSYSGLANNLALTVNVDAGGGQLATHVLWGGNERAYASSGGNAVGTAGGIAGTAPIGNFLFPGGAGFASDTLAGAGGGGGGCAGAYSAGHDGVNSVGGAGGGVAGLFGYGAGGAGNTGGAIGVAGLNGVYIGGGGGGSGDGALVGSSGADGFAVVFYIQGQTGGNVSLSHRADVVAGAGIINYLPGATFPTVITDCDIGDAITLPWWIVSGIAGAVVQLTEYSYEEEE